MVKVKKTKKKVMETSGNTTFVTRENLSELRIDDNIANNVELMSDEWTSLNPSDKNMGVVKFHLDKGVSTTVVGTVYGLDFEINVKGCKVNVFFDYYNKRLKIFDYKVTDFSALTKRLVWLAKHNKFDKIFVKARKRDFQRFLSHGFVMEGILRYYFNGEDAYVLSRFSSKSRAISKNLLSESELIEDLISRSPERAIETFDVWSDTVSDEFAKSFIITCPLCSPPKFMPSRFIISRTCLSPTFERQSFKSFSLI